VHLLRKHCWALAQNLDEGDLPDDLNEYVIGGSTVRDEL
jgi:hypothetical protein